MIRVFCIVGFIFTIIATVNGQFRFDYSFYPKVAGWLKLHVIPATFYDAFRQCEAEGSVLASPTNIYLKNAMVSLHKKTIGLNYALYTGIHSAVGKRAYASVEGIPLSRIAVDWAPNEPDNYNNNENCIVMLQNGNMADVQCSETFPFVCYKKKTANMAVNECGTIDNEYYLEPRTGSCYKFHYIGRTWSNAHMTCMAEGGHLAIINNNIEAQVLSELFGKYPREKIVSPRWNGVHLGFFDWGEKGVWYTIHGQKLQKSGYSKFSPGQPDNDTTFDNGSFCGAMFRDARLDDIWCNGVNIAFICEKKPESLLAGEDEQ